MIRVKEMRKIKGLTQQALADLACIDQSAISKIERGKRYPSRREATALANALGTSIDFLCGFTDDPSPYPPAEKRRYPQ